MDKKIVFLDGEYLESDSAKVSVFDHGVLYGDGIFEGIRAYNGRVFRCEDHVDRLFSAAKALMIDMPYSREEVTEIICETCRRNNLRDGYIRLVVTRGKGDLGLSPGNCGKPSMFCIASNIKLYSEETYENGMSLVTTFQRRNNSTIVDPQIKSLNYLNNILAKIEADRAGADEGLLLSQEGWVAECTGDNIFIVKDGTVYTPPTYVGILNGITRRTIVEICREKGIPLEEVPFTLFNVYNADECFLTGTAAEAIAVTSVDGRIIGTGRCGETTREILKAFKEFANSDRNGVEIYK